MRRIEHARVVAIVAMLILSAGCEDSSPSSTGRDRDSQPNFVFVLVDDLDAFSPAWDAMPLTHDLIAQRGVEFSNAFAPDPVCCPARAAIHTGLYPHNNGIFSGSPPDGGYEVFATNGSEERTWNLRLQHAGYTTAFMGKYLNGYELDAAAVPPGWDEWFGLAGNFLDGFTYEANHNGTMEAYGSGTDDYQTDVLARQARTFLDRVDEDDEGKPFLLFLAPSAPHAPIVPAARHEDHPFADEPLPSPPNFDEADVSDKPLWIREGTPHLSQQDIDLETRLFRNGMGSLVAVDEMIAGLVDRLDDQGELDRTVFVFTSDNGFNKGAHRLRHKMVPYEESLRVPLVIAGPGIRAGGERRFVTQLDFAPTVLELAGVDLADDLDGRSLVPLLRGEDDVDWRTDFLVEFHGTYNDLLTLHTMADIESVISAGQRIPYSPSYRAIRSEQWLYVEWYAGDVHEYELYDMRGDPYQLENLLATPQRAKQYEDERADLQRRLEQLARCSGSTCRS